ncbi:RICIN domain-containing protein [Actinoplanes sp. NPDC048796]|uniref:RICIN domain-containing protein n=1 Tax=unclassified Actinoplanes TaxID=2626549 RepID=UPI0033F5E4CA
MTDTPDREDPVLVRPYVSTSVDTTEFTAVEDAEKWPEPGDDASTVVQPTVEEPAEEESKPPRRTDIPILRLAIFAGGALLAAGVAAFFVFGLGSGPELPQPGAALPAMPARAPIPDSSVAAASKSAAAASASASSSASASPSASASASASVSATPSIAVSGSLQPLVPGATSPAAPTSAPTTAPAVDRTGAITAASGRCLTRGGLFGIDGSPVNVAGCAGGDAQTFTLATDGTLHVDGKCATPGGDGTVRVGSCDGAGSWRTGEGGSLIAANGKCLTDPGRSGAATKVTECAGSAEQTWSLP